MPLGAPIAAEREIGDLRPLGIGPLQRPAVDEMGFGRRNGLGPAGQRLTLVAALSATCVQGRTWREASVGGDNVDPCTGTCKSGDQPYYAPVSTGEVAERFKAHAWNACIRETVSRVRIPLSPARCPRSSSFVHKHVAQWRMTLTVYCAPIRNSINEVDTEALLRVLQPIWDRSPETAKRLRAASKKSSMPPRCATSGQATTPAIGDHWEDCHA